MLIRCLDLGLDIEKNTFFRMIAEYLLPKNYGIIFPLFIAFIGMFKCQLVDGEADGWYLLK